MNLKHVDGGTCLAIIGLIAYLFFIAYVLSLQ